MKMIGQLSRDPIDYYLDIVRAKRGWRRAALRNIEPTVKILFERYAERTPNLIGTKPSRQFSRNQRAALRHSYNGETEPLDKLKKEIKATVGHNWCCYCLLDTGKSTDHYLPKQRFPEFSSCSVNLIPACSTCNEKRGDRFAVKAKRTFAHLQSEALPDVRWLSASAVMEGGMPRIKFGLYETSSLTKPQRDLLRRHYHALDLFRRFEDQSAEILGETRSIVAMVRGIHGHLSLKQIGDALRRLAADESQRVCKNYYKAVAYSALARSPQYI